MVSAANPDQLETLLAEKLYLAGDLPTQLDTKVLRELRTNPPDVSRPNLFAWYSFVSQFTDQIQNSWPEPPKEQKDEDDEFDLFGEDENLEEELKKQNEEKKKEHAAPVGKSTVVFEVKPVSPSVDLEELAKRIWAEVQLEGLTWGPEFKKVPIAFGIEKLLVGCVMFDTVSTDEIMENIQAITGLVEESDEEDEDEDDEEEEEEKKEEVKKEKKMVEGELVQSVDIQSFVKL